MIEQLIYRDGKGVKFIRCKCMTCGVGDTWEGNLDVTWLSFKWEFEDTHEKCT